MTPNTTQAAVVSAGVLGGSLGGYTIANTTDLFNSNSSSSSYKPTVMLVSDVKPDSLLSYTKKSNLQHLLNPLAKENKSWWDRAYRYKYLTHTNVNTLDSLFTGLKSHYSDDEDSLNNVIVEKNSLNKACDKAYKAVNSKYIFTNSLLKNISDFCTVEDTGFDISEPKSIVFESGYIPIEKYEIGVLSVPTNKVNLVKNIPENALWWKWAYWKRKSLLSDLSDVFKNVTEGWNKEANSKSLNNACEKAYTQNKTQLEAKNKKLLNEIKVLCTYNNKQALVLPGKDVVAKPFTLEIDPHYDVNYEAGVGGVEENIQKLANPKDSRNIKWWNWAYRNRYLTKSDTTSLTSFFQGLSQGYSTTNSKALNQACLKAYQQNKKVLEQNVNLLNEVKEFCTIDNKDANDLNSPKDDAKPGTKKSLLDIKPETYEFENGIGGVRGNKSRLVMPIHRDNEKWWRWAYRNWYLTRSDLNTIHQDFKGIKLGYSITDKNSLNKRCEQAYKRNKKALQDNNGNLLNLIKALCSTDDRITDSWVTPSDDNEPTGIEMIDKENDRQEKYKFGPGKLSKNDTLLVKPVDSKNEKWWRWVYRNRYLTFKFKSDLSNVYWRFRNLKKGYSNSTAPEKVPTSLNKQCEAAFNSMRFEIERDGGLFSKNISAFCLKDPKKRIDLYDLPFSFS